MNEAQYWKAQTEGWVDDHVHGKDVDDVVAIAGDVVVMLGSDWSDDDVKALYAGLHDAGIPVYATRGTKQVRIDAMNDRDTRLPVGFQ